MSDRLLYSHQYRIQKLASHLCQVPTAPVLRAACCVPLLLQLWARGTKTNYGRTSSTWNRTSSVMRTTTRSFRHQMDDREKRQIAAFLRSCRLQFGGARQLGGSGHPVLAAIAGCSHGLGRRMCTWGGRWRQVGIVGAELAANGGRGQPCSCVCEEWTEIWGRGRFPGN
jgi:hypothetical protein